MTDPHAVPTTAIATASLVLAIVGFILMGIPFFIGWFLGGFLDLLAIAFGVAALNQKLPNGVGRNKALAGIIIASISLMSVFIGAGSIW